MQTWWNHKKYGKDSICPITRVRLRSGKNKQGVSYTIFLPCKHGFVRSALIQWVGSQNGELPPCPMCRKEFDPIIVFLS